MSTKDLSNNHSIISKAMANNHKAINIFFLVIFTSTLSLSSSSAELIRRFQHKPTDKKSLSFLVVGDWGRRGLYNQSDVAFQMGIVGEKLDVDFVISTGDNFYDNGLTDIHDHAFYESFSDIYTSPSLQKLWYNVLGNHDYRGNVLAQLSPSLRRRDIRFFCMRSFALEAGIVEILFVDTTPFVDKYFEIPNEHSYDWRGVLPRKKYISNLLKGVESALKCSNASWKIVIGHHAIKSAGHHGNTLELESQLLPILETHNVDFYINGHDHCLEHIIDSKSQIQFLTSGAGSKAWRGDVKSWDPNELKLYYDGQGFMSMEINESFANFAFYDIYGNVLHKWGHSKELALLGEKKIDDY